MSGKLHILTSAGLRLGCISAEACIFLYEQNAASLMTYGLAFCPIDSARMSRLNMTQTAFANLFLGLDESTPGEVGCSELGLLDFRLRAARFRILLLHRVLSNPEDTITRKMLEWEITPSGGTFIDSCNDLLIWLGSAHPLSIVLDSPYVPMSFMLHELTLQAQLTMWWDSRHTLAVKTNSHHLSKMSWGFEDILSSAAPEAARAYISFRSGNFHPPSGKDYPHLCGLCAGHAPTTPLLLWHCPSLEIARNQIIRDLQEVDPRLAIALSSVRPSEATHMVLGAAAQMVCEPTKSLIKKLCAKFILTVNRIVMKHDDLL
jgi:hypothetical protein